MVKLGNIYYTIRGSNMQHIGIINNDDSVADIVTNKTFDTSSEWIRDIEKTNSIEPEYMTMHEKMEKYKSLLCMSEEEDINYVFREKSQYPPLTQYMS